MKMQESVEFFGSKTEIARILGKQVKTVCSWGDDIPRRYGYRLRVEMENYQGGFDEVAALERVKASIEKEAARKLKAVDRMISSIKEGKDDE
jgi:hypothetical protein